LLRKQQKTLVLYLATSGTFGHLKVSISRDQTVHTV